MGRWLVDSGASSYMTYEKELLTDYKNFEKPEKVCLGDGRTVDAVDIGNVQINILFRLSDPKKCVIYDVLFLPNLTCNLFSVRSVSWKYIKFGESRCWIQNKNSKLCGKSSLVDKLYQLDCEHVPVEGAMMTCEQSDINLWHQRLRHLSGQWLNDIVQKEIVTSVKFPKGAELSFCEGCVEGKMHRKQFKPVGEIHSTRNLQVVHGDVCGPMSKDSIGGSKYFVPFIDNYSRCCSVYFIKHKSEVLDKFKEFEAVTTNDCG